MDAFIKFGLEKKIRLSEVDIKSVLNGTMIRVDDFVSLLVLASCGGERTKLGVGNFKNLMKHMGIRQIEPSVNDFDSGRDSSTELRKTRLVEPAIIQVDPVTASEGNKSKVVSEFDSGRDSD